VFAVRRLYRLSRVDQSGNVLYEIGSTDKALAMQVRLAQLGFDHDTIVNLFVLAQGASFACAQTPQACGEPFIVLMAIEPLPEG